MSKSRIALLVVLGVLVVIAGAYIAVSFDLEWPAQ